MRTFCFALALATLASVACTVSTFSSAQTQPAAATAAADKKPVAAVTPKPKPQTNAKAAPCDEEIPLGVLTGSEADSLASTLSSVFSDSYIVTSSAADSSSSGSDPAGAGAGSKADSGSAPKHLCLALRTNADSSLAKKSAKKGAKGTQAARGAKVPARGEFDHVLAMLDQDNFKGVTLDSNFIIAVTNPRLHASTLAKDFPHPASDLDLKQVKGDALDQYLIAVPSAIVVGQPAATSVLTKHAAELKQDLQLLVALEAEGDSNADALRRAVQACPHLCAPPTEGCRLASTSSFCKLEWESERWLAGHTIVLSILDPRDVVLQFGGVFLPKRKVVASMRNHAVIILPEEVELSDGTYLVAGAIEQDVLYRRDQADKAAEAAADKQAAGAKAAATPAPITTTSTTKTSVTSSAASGASPSTTKAPAPTTTTETTTTITPPPASGSGGVAAGKSASGSGSGSGSSSDAGTGSSGGSGSGNSSGGGQSSSPSTGSTATPKGWPIGQPFPMDRVQRLYHFRHATAIAAAINKASGSKDVDLVEPLGDADDQLLILPPTTADGHDPYNDIHRAIAMIDLPRPQLSLQVWSYEISSEIKNKNRDNNSIEKQGKALNKVQKYFEEVRQSVLTANDRMTLALQDGFGAVLDRVSADGRDAFFDPTFAGYLSGRYQNCVGENHYCLGYYGALEAPVSWAAGNRVMDASLSRMFLFLIAASDDQNAAGQTMAMEAAQAALKAMEDHRCKGKGPFVGPDYKGAFIGPDEEEPLCFPGFRNQLETLVQPRNLRAMRAALLDFFFQYKQIYVYFNDFVPYDLQRTAHEVDSLLSPIVNAFNQDVDNFVGRTMGSTCADGKDECGKEKIKGLANKGVVQVSAISGTKAQVSGAVDNYFDITPPMSLSDILNPNQNAVSALKGILEPKEITLLTAVANMGSQPRIHAQVSENANLTITPTAL
ncbi:MAG: hypothetical protein WAM78_09345, partial [Candidatus Sulfotelmatobacter sp.]